MTPTEHRVYTAAQVRQLDQIAIQQAGIPAYTLMSRAGQASFDQIRAHWPDAHSLCILCGSGNNGGDGYIIARLALQAGWQVSVIALSKPQRLQDTAQQAFTDFSAAGGQAQAFDGELPPADVMVDALLGTGLDRKVEGAYAVAIQLLNTQSSPIAAHPAHAPYLNLQRPELMVHAVESPASLRAILPNIDAIGIGPGMAQTAWSRALLSIAQNAASPKVLDADALNLLAQTRSQRDDWILTPHPGEAARLLACTSAEVEDDRINAARRLQHVYGGVIVLKGAGTLVASANGIAFCPAGNPGMASGGMGDALTGIITSLLAQGLSLSTAADTGVWLHAHAADLAASNGGERGLLASDVIAHLREILNNE